MALQILINTIDRTSLVDWPSVQKIENLTKEPDTLDFMLRDAVNRGYTAALEDVVQFYRDGALIFAGKVAEISYEIGGLLQYTKIKCIDYTADLAQLLVSKTYTSTTASAIIADIITNFAPAFTGVNVVAPDTVDNFVVNYLSVPQTLQKLADMIGGYDWYVDYTKDIHFFKPSANPAPFNLDDTSGNFLWNTLKLDTNNSQIRNDIIIRGGETIGTSVTNIQVADGVQVVFFVGYNLNPITAYKALAASPTSFSALTIGRDGIDSPASFDTLYNPDKGLLIFPDATKPAVNDRIKYVGTPVFPLITRLQDGTSITNYGQFQYLIVDKTITTKAAAKARALAEIIEYGDPLRQGSFQTQKAGLISGMTITISSTIRGISDTYKIQRITSTVFKPNTGELLYTVEIISTVKLTMIDVLNKLLVRNVSDQIDIGANEVLDLLASADETVTIAESVATSISHNLQTESATIAESVTVQALNYAVIFVAGQQSPSGFKRQFVCDGSRVG